MAYVNTKARSHTEKDAHLNWMGGPSFDIKDPLIRLQIAASSCFFGEPMYYHRDKGDTRPKRDTDSRRVVLTDADVERLREVLDAVDPREWRTMTPAALMESAIDAALDANVEATLELAAKLRNEDHIRVPPQVILVRAANHKALKGTGLVRKYASRIVKRADEPATGLAYQLGKYGKDAPIPNSLKSAWSDALEHFDEYALAKYRMEEHEVKLVDVVNLVRPKSEAVSKLVKGELKATDQTWEAIISKEGSTVEAWTKAIDVMGHMALLRNVRNLIQKGVPMDLFLDKLVEGAPKGKQLPFRYFSAYKAVGDASGKVKDAIEQCLEVSLGNLPHFNGRMMSLCDNSGSAWSATTSTMGTMHVAEIANLTAILSARRADDGYIGMFGDRLAVRDVRKKTSIFADLDEACCSGKCVAEATENGIWLFWDQAIREKEHWDHVFVFSDMQAGHGGLYGTSSAAYREYIWPGSGGGHRYIDVPKLINKYRSAVNPNVNVYLVQVAGYQDTIVPEFYNRTYILGGWSEGLLRFAAKMAGMPQQ